MEATNANYAKQKDKKQGKTTIFSFYDIISLISLISLIVNACSCKAIKKSFSFNLLEHKVTGKGKERKTRARGKEEKRKREKDKQEGNKINNDIKGNKSAYIRASS